MPLLKVEGVSKSFPGTRALADVDFDLQAGEVHILLGENGAGKSTLIKILSGAITPDSGAVSLDGRRVEGLDPHAAQRLGIATIYQEFNLIPDLTVAENIFLGRLPLKASWPRRVDWLRMMRDAGDFFERFGIAIDPDRMVHSLSIAEQQLVEIAKALSIDARVLILDEPTATLTRREIAALFALIGRLRSQGLGIIYISHRLEEVAEIGDRVSVLRDGRKIGTWTARDLTTDDMIRAMVGRDIAPREQQARKPSSAPGDIVLEARGIASGRKVRHVDLALRRGEILGLGGLVGAGRTEVARVLFGVDPLDAGEIFIKGERIAAGSCAGSIRRGLSLLPEDRKSEGLLLSFSVQRNVTLPSLDKFQRFGFLRGGKEREATVSCIDLLSIRTTGPRQPVSALSGGNQQKVVLAKWLYTRPDILIFDEPTRGIDVGAKEEIYRIILDCAAQGASILLISSELSELMRLCDRIIVLREGRVAGSLDRAQFETHRLLSLAFGQSAN